MGKGARHVPSTRPRSVSGNNADKPRVYCDDSDYLTNIPVLNDVTPKHSIRFRGDVVIDIELARKLCCDVVEASRDSAREQELLNLLQAVLNEDDKQVRIRMALLNWQATPIC